MNHPAELALHQYLRNAIDGKSEMSQDIIDKIKQDIGEALDKQFNTAEGKQEFKLRMSNVGRPKCQLWFDKNNPESKLSDSPFFLINMMLGDIVEAVFKGHESTVTSVAFSPDGRRIASGGWDRILKIWDVTSGKTTMNLKGHTGRITSVAFSPDGKRLVSGGGDDDLKIWDIKTGEEITPRVRREIFSSI